MSKKGQGVGKLNLFYGKKHTKEAREKMKQAAKNRLPITEITREKMSRVHKGKRHTEESKKKISDTKKNGYHPMRGKKMSEEVKQKISKTLQLVRMGKNNPAWKGGVYPIREAIRGSFKYRQWRSDIFTRDDFTCQKCNRRGGYLEAHHIQPFVYIIELNDIKNFEQAMACEELWNINNGITLCIECHKKRKGE